MKTAVLSLERRGRSSPVTCGHQELPLRRLHSLKLLFRSAPLPNLPDCNLQFTVGGNTSDVGLEAGLFQGSPRDKKVPPSFFSRDLASPAERNYDVGNRELLALEKREKAIALLCPHPCPCLCQCPEREGGRGDSCSTSLFKA